ncbi:MAG TPA: glycosyltransferase [Novosphingobium sp.]|nr:glycosyltransferase [Novosphingobium sp.]
MTATEPFSVIIPAHNEANVIARCLTTILADAPDDGLEILVVCNGCRDDTAARAGAVSPMVRVIELDKGSKPLALNTGNAEARHAIRLFVDADTRVSYHALAALAEVLRGGQVKAASPALDVDLTAVSFAVRGYYRVWLQLPYVLDNMVGSGVFGLSPEGMAAIGEFPPIIADDEFVRTRFPSAERCLLREDAQGRPVFFTIFPPRTLWSLIRVESRQRAGVAQLHERYPSSETRRMTTWPALLATLRRGASLIDLFFFLLVKGAGRLHFQFSKMRKLDHRWLRDDTSRQVEA